jgi:hypothetical protein
MCQYFWTGKVIDGNNIDALHVVNLAVSEAAYSPESIDGYFNCAHD